MKVLCIDTGHSTGVPPLVEGEVYTVIGEGIITVGIQIAVVYILAEMPQGCGYGKGNFIPLSSIDETEFERNYIKELV